MQLIKSFFVTFFSLITLATKITIEIAMQTKIMYWQIVLSIASPMFSIRDTAKKQITAAKTNIIVVKSFFLFPSDKHTAIRRKIGSVSAAKHLYNRSAETHSMYVFARQTMATIIKK